MDSALVPHSGAYGSVIAPDGEIAAALGGVDHPMRNVRIEVKPQRRLMALVYKKTGNLRACQLLLGRWRLESTVRYLGIEVDDALELSEQLEI